MAKTLAQIHKQIAKLQKEATELKAKEVVGVIERIREAIEHYGITARELFHGGAKATLGAASRPTAKKAAAKNAGAKKAGAKKAPLPPKYHDGSGKTWSGAGKRPNWFKAAIANGKTATDLLIK